MSQKPKNYTSNKHSQGAFGWVFGSCFFFKKKPKANQRDRNQKLLFPEVVIFRWHSFKNTLNPAFGFPLFEMVEIESYFIAVSRKVKIRGRFYTCLNQTTYNFFIAHNP